MKKLLYVFMIFTITLSLICPADLVAAVIPRIGIGSPSSGTVEVGGTIKYNVNIYNNAENVTLKASDVRISGVTANVSIEGSGTKQRTIVLSNIQGSVGAVGYISYVAGGVATNSAGGSKAFEGTSTSFTIVATVNNTPAPEPEPPQNNNNNNPQPTLPPSVNNTPDPTPEPEEPEEEPDETAPTMKIGEFNESSIKLGEEISFEIKYEDDKEMGDITLDNNDITLYGFKADIKISGEGNTRTVTLSNVQGHLGGMKYVVIASNTAKDKAGNEIKDGGKTAMFKVIDNDTKNKPDDWIENPNTGR